MSSFNITKKTSPGYAEKVSKMLAHHAARTISRQELFALQYTKLCNYFGAALCTQWGGDHLGHGSVEILKLGLAQFLTDVNKVAGPDDQWISRVNIYEPWSPENLIVGSSPSPELGAEYDPYIASHGVMIKLQYAARLLAIPHLELLQLKLNLLVDSLVIREAILRMLRPRPLWPEVVIKAGNLNKTLGANA
jgi:hypothetical protein